MAPLRSALRPALLLLSLAALLVGAPGVRAGDEDDLDRLRKEIDRISSQNDKTRQILDELEKKSREEFLAKGYSCFVDQSHWVRTKDLDKGWDIPILPQTKTFGVVFQDGLQAAGAWSSKKEGAPARAVTARVLRFAHLVPGSEPGKPAATKIDPEGKEIPHSKPLDLVAEYHRLAMARLEPAPEAPPKAAPGKPAPEVDPAVALGLEDAKACVKPGRKSLGLMKYFAAAQGRQKDGGKRIRWEWYAWSGKDSVYKGKDVTWVLAVTYDESVLDTRSQLALGRDFANAIATY